MALGWLTARPNNIAMTSTALTLTAISSMATRLVLNELAQSYRERTGVTVVIESVGGVDAAQRVQAGEVFDAVFLGAAAMAKLEASGHVVAGSVVPLFNSATAVAVRSGSPHPDIHSEAAVRAAVAAAPSVSYSTGPSGVALAAQFERWGLAPSLSNRLITPPPGTPVGSLVATGEVALGFQQLSELLTVDGIDIVGVLPPDMAINTIFAGGVCASSPQVEAVRAMLLAMASPQSAALKRRHGMEPA
jgi:molybdate transport system substrate-binding protein